jgi:ketosteroid isomerase-like protein
MKHTHAAVLEKFYTAYKQGDLSSVLSEFPEKFTLQVAGKSRLAGKYARSAIATEFVSKFKEFSGGTFAAEVHDILASDLHGTALVTNRLTRSGKTIEYREVQVWRFEGGQPVAWYLYPRDLYQFDEIWG